MRWRVVAECAIDANASNPTPPASAARWLAILGPGAIIASLTIGSGELVFSSRGGALFGYRMLSVFLLVCLFKWALTFATARHLVLTGAHPFQRWASLPGPHAWLPWVFLLLAIPAFPIFVSFHAGTLGTLGAALTSTTDALGGASYLVWGIGVLLVMFMLACTGGYERLERIQLVVVALLLGATGVALLVLQPDWGGLIGGFFTFPARAYPDWVQAYPEISERAVWVELTTYVGIVGGSGYDYLAYGAFLREKHWGHAGKQVPVDEASMESARSWLRAPLTDCTISFAIVLLFSAAFVACGAEILAKHQEIPQGDQLLTLQAEFVAVVSPWLKPLYYLGAILAMAGTLYGTINVAPAIGRELGRVLLPGRRLTEARLVRGTIVWVCLGGLTVLLLKLVLAESGQSPALVALVTPANLFTGVFACGIIAWLAVWADRRFLPSNLAPSPVLVGLNLIGGAGFLVLGVKGYWDHSGGMALLILGGTLAIGWFVAWSMERRG